MATLAQDRKIPSTWKKHIMFGCIKCGQGTLNFTSLYYDPDDEASLHTICPECGDEKSILYSEL